MQAFLLGAMLKYFKTTGKSTTSHVKVSYGGGQKSAICQNPPKINPTAHSFQKCLGVCL